MPCPSCDPCHSGNLQENIFIPRNSMEIFERTNQRILDTKNLYECIKNGKKDSQQQVKF